MTDFLTIQEAVTATGKSQSTITRFARKYKNNSGVRTNSGRYEISRKLLGKHFDLTNHDYSETNQSNENDYFLTNHDYSGKGKETETEFLREQVRELTTRVKELHYMHSELIQQNRLLQEQNAKLLTDRRGTTAASGSEPERKYKLGLARKNVGRYKRKIRNAKSEAERERYEQLLSKWEKQRDNLSAK